MIITSTQSCFKKIELFYNLKSFLGPASKHGRRKMSATVPLDTIPKVDMDKSGVFKYILLKVYNKDNKNDTVTIVRGYGHCNYHSDIFDEVQGKLSPLELECLGGGRISHDSDFKRIKIYGYSQGYGKADHEVAAKIIKDFYPKYTITISDEGY